MQARFEETKYWPRQISEKDIFEPIGLWQKAVDNISLSTDKKVLDANILIFPDKHGAAALALLEKLNGIYAKFIVDEKKRIELILDNMTIITFGEDFKGIVNWIIYGDDLHDSKHIYYCESLETAVGLLNNMKKKFNIILGNPPYQPEVGNRGQGKGTGNKIWPKFVEAAFGVLKIDGILCYITPSHWRTGNLAKGQVSKAQELIWRKSILTVKNCNEYFEKIATHMSIDYWLVRNSVPKVECNTALSKVMFLPVKSNNPAAIEEFYGRTFQDDCYIMDIKRQDCMKFDHIKQSVKGDHIRKYRHANTTAQIRVSEFDWYSVATPGFDSKKVMICKSVNIKTPGNFVAFYNGGDMGCGGNMQAYSVKNKAEGLELAEFINNSSVIRDIIEECNGPTGYSVPIWILRKIPKSMVREFNENRSA